VGKKRLLRRRSCNSLSKRDLCFSGCPHQGRIHPADRGGEEVKKSNLVAAGLGGGPLELLEVRLPAVLHLRRRCAVVAIFGQRNGCAALIAMVGASFVFLYRVSATTRSPAKPSGFVPGLDWGGAASMLVAAGARHGLDCVLAVLFRVFAVKVQGHVVIFLIS
jgi:hypothetical protein